jgi:hypothetical protein
MSSVADVTAARSQASVRLSLRVSDMLGGVSTRETVRPADGKSQATFERVTIDGERYFLKRSSPNTDWVMRATGDRSHRPYLIWQAGILDRLPRCMDHTIVAMELEGSGDQAELRILMRDVGAYLVPEGDTVVPELQHGSFIEHMAELAVSFWGWQDSIGGLTTMSERVRLFDYRNIARELARADPAETILCADSGLRALGKRAPRLATIARAVHDDPTILTAPLAATPVTFLHGDWKMGNLGSHPDGRTILLDWALPGSGPVCWDLCWYLALNRARLPETKESTIARFRVALERRGVEVSSWFDTQLDLCTIGIMATFGWEKALGDDAELRWWERRVLDAAVRQNLDLRALRKHAV